MAYEDRAGSMSLFKNERKEKNSHPDYTGSGMDLDGRPVWISAWLKETRDGKKFFSISLKLRDQPREDNFRGGGGASSGDAGGGRDLRRADPFDDEVPFARQGVR